MNEIPEVEHSGSQQSPDVLASAAEALAEEIKCRCGRAMPADLISMNTGWKPENGCAGCTE